MDLKTYPQDFGLTHKETQILSIIDELIEASTTQIRTELIKQSRFKGFWAEILTGYPYTALHRLERNGILKARWGVATEERGWKRPRLYSRANYRSNLP
jgi:DNA-binding PadR family transcriptional regulator